MYVALLGETQFEHGTQNWVLGSETVPAFPEFPFFPVVRRSGTVPKFPGFRLGVSGTVPRFLGFLDCPGVGGAPWCVDFPISLEYGERDSRLFSRIFRFTRGRGGVDESPDFPYFLISQFSEFHVG